jgi:RNA polymerase sigma-70 factor (ECF subfamily)
MNEQIIIQQAMDGDHKSFSLLVAAYQNQLATYLVSRCHNTHDAEDIVQETFINAYKYLRSYKSQWQFSTWLYTIANRLINKHKKQFFSNKEQLISQKTTAIDESFKDDMNIWYTIKSIINNQAFDVLWFYYVEEFSIKEIAQILHSSQSWVKMTLFRSKRKLAKNENIYSLFQQLLTAE